MKKEPKSLLEKSRRKVSENAQLLASNPEFQADIIKLRRKWNLPDGGLQSGEREKWWKEVRDPSINAIRKDIITLIKKNQLNPKIMSGLIGYLWSNKEQALMMTMLSPVVKKTVNEDGFEEISVVIDENTSHADYVDAWKRVLEFRDDLVYKKRKKQQPIKNLKRDRRIFELWGESKTSRQIADTIYDEFGEVIGYEYIPILKKRFQNRTDTNH